MAVDAAEIGDRSSLASKGFRSVSRRLLVVALSYVLTGALGLAFYPTGGFATLIWAPSAISIVAIVLWGPGRLAGDLRGRALDQSHYLRHGRPSDGSTDR